MCGLAGAILGEKPRTGRELNRLAGIFTRLLVASEPRGPHATGAAWVNTDGEYELFKQPMPASKFVKQSEYARLLTGLDERVTVLMGHARWRTCGDERNNANNHPVLAGDVIGTHNGTILNADDLFRRLRYRRDAEVDTEILCRIVNGATRDGALDVSYLRQRLALCRGQMAAVFASRRIPGTVLLLKGDKPLKFRCHRQRQVVLYATDGGYLDEALASERGWMEMNVPPMTLLVFQRPGVCPPFAGDFSFTPQARVRKPQETGQ